jgi:hypothetical protein
MLMRISLFLLLGLVLPTLVLAQSTTQDFPTPVTTNEIDGTINARDVGDARLTTYFYTFNGTQGDLFINVNSQNFNGDIDVFTADGLDPVTKIVMYADSSVNETGRVVYLRKPEKLILRVQGRTPGDDPATFRIKFAGSFLAAADTGREEPALPKVTAENETGIKVNSVGTIVEVPKKTEVAKANEEPPAAPEEKKVEEEKPAEISEERAETKRKRVEVVVTDNTKPEAVAKKAPPVRTVRPRRTPPKRTVTAAKTASREKAPPKEKAPDPLENVHLIIEFKDGKRIERKMSDVFRFTVDKGILTVVSKDGTIGRYNILDIVRTTIE